MKVIRIEDDAHRGLRIAAAKSGFSDLRTGTLLMRYVLDLLEAGKLDIKALDRSDKKRTSAKA